MRGYSPLLCLFVVVLTITGLAAPSLADVTPEQTKELREIKTDLAKVAALLRKKEFDEVQTLLDDAQLKLTTIMEDAAVPETNRRLIGLPKLIASRRKALDLQRRKTGGGPAKQATSFSGDVAPIVVEHCLECHGGGNPRAGLNLSTFAGWKRGGVGGPLLVPGAPLKSLLIARLTANNPEHRMPRGRDPLSKDDLNSFATWINAGATFDGDGEDTALSELAKPRPKVEIPKPQGTETVSFTKDIAPFVVRLCLNCHSGNNPRGGLLLTTFENMMVGGDSGAVILPGKRDESRLFRLVGGLENPRMPQSDARLTRENYDKLVKWFDEGNVFDGDDPRALLTSYVPTAEQLSAERFAQMSAAELLTHRQERTEELWKQSLPAADHQTLETDQFLLFGDVTDERLATVQGWADEHLEMLQETFTEKPAEDGTSVWRGKLAILVFKERFGLTEYFLSVRSIQQSEGLFGESVTTPSFSDAYIVLLDTGDESTQSTPGLQTNLRNHLTVAYISRGTEGNPLVTRGGGLYLAAQQEPGNLYFRQLPITAAERLRTVNTPDQLFAEGALAPADVGAVGYTMVTFFAKQAGREIVIEFIDSFRKSQDADDAMMSVAGSSLETFGESFLNAVRQGR